MACLEGLPGGSLLSLKGTWDVLPKKPQDFWKNVLWVEKTKVVMFGQNAQDQDAQDHVWQKPNTVYRHKHLTPTGDGLMIRARSVAAGPGHLAGIELTISSSIYQIFLESNVRSSVPKHISKSTTQQLKKNRMKVLRGPSLSADFTRLKDYGGTLKGLSVNLNKLKQACEEEQPKSHTEKGSC